MLYRIFKEFIVFLEQETYCSDRLPCVIPRRNARCLLHSSHTLLLPPGSVAAFSSTAGVAVVGSLFGAAGAGLTGEGKEGALKGV